MTSSKITFREPPKFLSILGSQGVEYNEKDNSAVMKFIIGEELTHSNGTIVQGGFITAMLDTTMAHLLILKGNEKINPLSLNVNVTFITPGAPGDFISSAKINKLGNSIAFTSAELHQNDILVATATGTNKLIKI